MYRSLIAAAGWGILILASCKSLPDAQDLNQRYATQAVQFKNGLEELSAKKSAAIVAALKKKSGKLDILERQIALEQEIVGSPLVVGNKVALLEDGPATYQAMEAAISRAKVNINVECYDIEDDQVGRRFADLLVAKQAQGVQVNLIYDSLGALKTPEAFFDRLRESGIRVIEFNTVKPLKMSRPPKLGRRAHRKLMVVDGRTAFVGGINIAGVYASGSSLWGNRSAAGSEGWRDTDVQIDGPAAAEFQKLFVRTWTAQHGDALPEKSTFPRIDPQGREIVRAIGSTPNDPYSRTYLTFISAIMNAENQVFVANAYFVPDPQLCQALSDAAGRGVDVRLLVPANSDFKAAYYAGHSYYTQLLEGGVKIYERRGPLLHAKTAVIDGVWSYVGSANLDWRSALGNQEAAAVILGQEFGRKMQTVYVEDLAASDRIDLTSWKRRPLPLRLKEWTARLFSRLLSGGSRL